MSRFESQFIKRYGKKEKDALYVEVRHNPFTNDWWVYSSERNYPLLAKDETDANYMFSYLHKAIKTKIGEKW